MMKRYIWGLVGVCFAVLVLQGCSPTYRIQMSSLISFNLSQGATCEEVLKTLGRPHLQVARKGAASIGWQYNYRIVEQGQKTYYTRYLLVMVDGKLKSATSSKSLRGQPRPGYKGAPRCPRLSKAKK